jgi:hypothetical protein
MLLFGKEIMCVTDKVLACLNVLEIRRCCIQLLGWSLKHGGLSCFFIYGFGLLISFAFKEKGRLGHSLF